MCALESTVHEAAEHKATNLVTDQVASIGCPETSVTSYQPTVQDIPGQRRLHRPNFETGAELARSVMHEIIEFVMSH
jgi:hypothetical protein